MKTYIRDHVAQYCESKGWGTDDDDIIETIKDAKRLHRKEIDQSRWWNEYRYVVELDGMIIGYIDAETTGDMSPWETGYEFDPSTICEMQPVEKTVMVYETLKITK